MGKTSIKINRDLRIRLSTIPSYEKSKINYKKIMAPRCFKKDKISLSKQLEKSLHITNSTGSQ